MEGNITQIGQLRSDSFDPDFVDGESAVVLYEGPLGLEINNTDPPTIVGIKDHAEFWKERGVVKGSAIVACNDIPIRSRDQLKMFVSTFPLRLNFLNPEGVESLRRRTAMTSPSSARSTKTASSNRSTHHSSATNRIRNLERKEKVPATITEEFTDILTTPAPTPPVAYSGKKTKFTTDPSTTEPMIDAPVKIDEFEMPTLCDPDPVPEVLTIPDMPVRQTVPQMTEVSTARTEGVEAKDSKPTKSSCGCCRKRKEKKTKK